jgi:hypothetical protein
MVDMTDIKRFMTKLDDLIGDAEYNDETIGAGDSLQDARDHVVEKLNEAKRGIEREIRQILDSSDSTENKLDEISGVIEEAEELTDFLKVRG